MVSSPLPFSPLPFSLSSFQQPSKCSTTSEYGALAAAMAGAAAAAGTFQQQQQPRMMARSTAMPSMLLFDDGRGGRNPSSLPLVTPLARPGLLDAPAPPRKSSGALFEETRADLGAAMATAATTASGSGSAGGVSVVETSFAETTTAAAAAALLSSLPPAPPSLLSGHRPHPASAPERRGRPPRPPAASRSFARVRVRRTLDMRAGSPGSGSGNGKSSSSVLRSGRDPLAPLPAAATKVRFHAAGSSGHRSLPLQPPPSGFLPASKSYGSGNSGSSGGSGSSRRRADTPGCCGGRLAGRRARRPSVGGGELGRGAENDSESASNAAAGLVAKLSLDGL